MKDTITISRKKAEQLFAFLDEYANEAECSMNISCGEARGLAIYLNTQLKKKA